MYGAVPALPVPAHCSTTLLLEKYLTVVLFCRSLQVALEQLGRNSQDLSGLRAELNSEHQSQLDTREAALQAQEAELRGTHPNCILIINTAHILHHHFMSPERLLII
jgi:hypothetical protein